MAFTGGATKKQTKKTTKKQNKKPTNKQTKKPTNKQTKKPTNKQTKKPIKKPVKKSNRVSAAQKREAIKKLNELREKLIDLRRNNSQHFGDKTLVQEMKRNYFSQQNLSDESPRKSGLVLFYANWCPHCHTVIPIMNELAERINQERALNDMMVGAIDCATPENDIISDEMGIQGYPTIKIYNNGEYVGDYNGPREVPFLLTLLKKMKN
jgi:thiol-disulfide isomerase/thioredoxin